jgi:hypothetical protein
MCLGNKTSVINLDLTWKQSFLLQVILASIRNASVYAKHTYQHLYEGTPLRRTLLGRSTSLG